MRADHKRSKAIRWVLLVMWLIPIPFWILLIIDFFPETLLTLLVQLLWTILLAPGLIANPKITLTEEGILVNRFFWKKLYPWNQIAQAGILWRMGKGIWYNDFVLLLQGGSRRGYKDKTFLLRNIGKLIHMDPSDPVQTYVRKHYGPLDFDLSDGRSENSIIIE